jgi:hypothetical protein
MKFELRANLGKPENPLFAIIPIDEKKSLSEAKRLSHAAVRQCDKFLNWTLYSDGEPTGWCVESYPQPESGIVATISIKANDVQDACFAMDVVRKQMEAGDEFRSDENETFSYDFDISSGE